MAARAVADRRRGRNGRPAAPKLPQNAVVAVNAVGQRRDRVRNAAVGAPSVCRRAVGPAGGRMRPAPPVAGSGHRGEHRDAAVSAGDCRSAVGAGGGIELAESTGCPEAIEHEPGYTTARPPTMRRAFLVRPSIQFLRVIINRSADLSGPSVPMALIHLM